MNLIVTARNSINEKVKNILKMSESEQTEKVNGEIQWHWVLWYIHLFILGFYGLYVILFYATWTTLFFGMYNFLFYNQ